MFVAGYPFQKVKTVKHDLLNPHLVSNILYRFDTRKGNRYLVEVHEHKYKVFVVKFYLSKDRNNKKKYNILTNTYEWGGVLRTIFDICVHLNDLEYYASFAFLGAYKISSKQPARKHEDQTTPNNQRFRIYKKITEAFLGEGYFEHFKSEKANCYLLVNKNNPDCDTLGVLIAQMMCITYAELGALIIQTDYANTSLN